jgi:hypothetical protein
MRKPLELIQSNETSVRTTGRHLSKEFAKVASKRDAPPISPEFEQNSEPRVVDCSRTSATRREKTIEVPLLRRQKSSPDAATVDIDQLRELGFGACGGGELCRTQ